MNPHLIKIVVVVFLVKFQCLIFCQGKRLSEDFMEIPKKRDTQKDKVRDTDANGKYVGDFNSDCVETLFITPSRKVVKIETEPDIIQTPQTRCHWTVIGTATCIPVLSCTKFKLAPTPDGAEEPCKDEYLEVTDGSAGYEKFCGTEGPNELTTSKNLRDLYITFQRGSNTKSITARGIKCTVTCSDGNHPHVLKNNFEQEVNRKCHCGRKPNANRIVGGEDAKRGEFPWIVGLVTAKTRKPYCGGTLISDRFVATAAHCFKGPYLKKDNFQILLNGHFMDLTSSSVAKGEARSAAASEKEILAADAKENAIRIDVEKYFIHPLYVPQTNDYDVALIKLKKPIDFKVHNFLQPACMPNPATYNLTYEGIQATVAGWGLNSSDSSVTMGTLQKLDVNIFDMDTCRTFYDERITRRMMCAGFKEPGKDSCKGDSGGPLISEKKKQVWHLIGIVSWGEGCAATNSPGVYLRVSEVEQWIRYISNMDDAVWCPE